MTQLQLEDYRGPDFDGRTYEHDRDYQRLGAQSKRVFAAITDGHWHTLSSISGRTGDPEASVSARLRDLRKGKFGRWKVERRNLGRGTWQYRLAGKEVSA